jgi:PAS domain S-box-containing protein
MDRVASKPAFVEEALRLTGAPACACDANGMVFAANPELAELLGIDMQGRALVELFRGRAAHAAGRIHAAFDADCRWDDVVTVGANELAVQIRAKPLPPAAGVRGASFVFNDLDAVERDRASTLHTALMEQHAILENVPVGIVFTQPGQLKSCNPRMAEMFGYTPQQLAGSSPRSLFASEEQFRAFADEALAALATGHMFEKAEHQFRRRDGSLFWGRVRARAVDPASRAAGTIWMVEDVTEARQAFIEAHAIMVNASISILFTRNGCITRYNRGFADMFGYDTEEALGMNTRALHADEDNFREMGAVANSLLAQGKPFHSETELLRKDGSPIWAQMIGYVVNPDDPSQGTIWIVEDRTRQKRDEQSLRDALL